MTFDIIMQYYMTHIIKQKQAKNAEAKEEIEKEGDNQQQQKERNNNKRTNLSMFIAC